MSLPARRIEPLESLRVIAALAVAIFHFRTPSPLAANAFIEHADLMVDLFFVLSGFVIALNYRERIGSFWDALTFQHRRFWRLYTLHLFTLMVFVGMWLLSAAYGAILEQELQQKVFDREPEELNALRAVERAELSKSEDLGGGYERISIEEAMRRLAPR